MSDQLWTWTDDPNRDAHRPSGRWTSVLGTLGLLLTGLVLVHAASDSSKQPAEERRVVSLGSHRWGEGPIFSLAWSPDGRTLAASSFGPLIRLWELETGKSATVVGDTENPRFVIGWSEDGRRLVVGGMDSPVETWDLDAFRNREGPVVDRVEGRSDRIGRLSIVTQGRPTRFWGPEDGRRTLLPPSSGRVNSVAFSPDGRSTATGGVDGTCRIWDQATGLERLSFPGDPRGITSVAFSPDGTKVASGGGGPVRVWDARSGAELATMGEASSGTALVAFAPSGERIAIAAWDGTIRIGDVAKGRELEKFHGHAGQVIALAWSPDGHTLATGGYDSTVKLWDVSQVRDRGLDD